MDDAMGEIVRRLDRVEAVQALQLLACRYAASIDARDIEQFISLYVRDVQVGGSRGRDALRSHTKDLFRHNHMGRTIHLVCGHTIELDENDPSVATGTVYCRAEHEHDGRWVIASMQYWDRYQREEGVWLFRSRKPMAWYVGDALDRPGDGGWISHRLTESELLSRADLPGAFPMWATFYAAFGDDV
jgi:hypothetical protein